MDSYTIVVARRGLRENLAKVPATTLAALDQQAVVVEQTLTTPTVQWFLSGRRGVTHRVMA